MQRQSHLQPLGVELFYGDLRASQAALVHDPEAALPEHLTVAPGSRFHLLTTILHIEVALQKGKWDFRTLRAQV